MFNRIGLVDMYSWNPHCRNIDATAPSGTLQIFRRSWIGYMTHAWDGSYFLYYMTHVLKWSPVICETVSRKTPFIHEYRQAKMWVVLIWVKQEMILLHLMTGKAHGGIAVSQAMQATISPLFKIIIIFVFPLQHFFC